MAVMSEDASAKIAVFNVKFSPNLGDGVIAECLEHELEQWIKGAHIFGLDLAGRVRWSAPTDARGRLLRLALLQRVPAWIRDTAVGLILGLYIYIGLRPAWRRALADVDFVIFGGGQLIQDGDLNFPLKLAAAASVCHRRDLPFAVFAVGATPSRSSLGRCLLRRLLKSQALVHVAARDAFSASALKSMGCERVALCRDPGLLAANLWPAPARPTRERPLVGVGITHPVLLKHHAAEDVVGDGAGLIDLYVALVRDLVATNCDVVCFSNGGAEDEAIITTLRERFAAVFPAMAMRRLRIAPRCSRPRDLAMLIASFDAVIAHRLHACILAYSYRIPHVGLAWDTKVKAFFTSVHRAAYSLPLNMSTKDTIVPLLRQAIQEGIDGAVHARVLAEASEGIRQLAERVACALRSPGKPGASTAFASFAGGRSWN